MLRVIRRISSLQVCHSLSICLFWLCRCYILSPAYLHVLRVRTVALMSRLAVHASMNRDRRTVTTGAAVDYLYVDHRCFNMSRVFMCTFLLVHTRGLAFLHQAALPFHQDQLSYALTLN